MAPRPLKVRSIWFLKPPALISMKTRHRAGHTHPDDDISRVPGRYHAPYMPESEPKPRPLEAVAPGSGQGWKATLKNGKAAVVHEIPVAPAAAAAAAPRLQRLAEHP